ncbi:MAG: peptidoglycan editing factor PgeF [Rhodanobacteraceae bacterium]|nr:peptidoglycan editing factor PgeF [Rhodanobacteraceae bacterium]
MTRELAALGVLIPDFPLPPGVRAAVTTRVMRGVSPSPFDACNLGSRCGDTPANVATNRKLIRRQLNLPSEPQWLRQVHGIEVHSLQEPGDPARDHQADPVADAVYCNRPGLVCVVQTADCLPLLLTSDDGCEVAAVHAGWRGLAAGVIEAALRQFSAAPARIRVWLGPAIGATSYEVGEDVRAAFIAHNARSVEAFAATRPGHWLCDLYALARQRLAAAGVVQIFGGSFDTFTDPRFYSHRRAHPSGRFASLIWIESAHQAARTAEAAGRALASQARRSQLIFPRLLGRSLLRLPQTVQALHLCGGAQTYRGGVTITRGRNWLARFCALVTGMPPAMNDAPLSVEIVAAAKRERWTRNFNGHRMRSAMWWRDGLLCERLGLVTFHFRLGVAGSALTWTVERVSVLGFPLPVSWFRAVKACEYEDGGRYCFDVTAALPLAGELVHYSGWLDVRTDWVCTDSEPEETDTDIDSTSEDCDRGSECSRGDGGDSGADGGD